MIKTPVKFQKDQLKSVGGVALTKYLLQTQNHASRKAENRKLFPLILLRKDGDNNSRQ